MEEELGKKSYRGFLVWLVIFFVTLMNIGFLPVEDPGVATKIIGSWVMFLLAIVICMIEKTQKVYWFSGISYEEAVKAGSERRKQYAKKHRKIFVTAFIIVAVYCAIGAVAHSPFGLDITVFIATILIATLVTVPIKL